MDLPQIRYFLAVCEALNFTRAAERCHVTQPSLTRAIQNLELELGGQLFIRARSGTALTPLGEAMRKELAQVQGHATSARVLAEGWTKGTRGVLRIGVSAAVGPLAIARFLGAFQCRHEGVTLALSEGSLEELLARLDRSDLDAALVACPFPLPSRPTARCLYDERLAVMVSTGHRLAALESVPVVELAGERVLLCDRGDLRNAVLPVLKAAGIEVNITCHCARGEWLMGMVAEGVGIAIVPEGFSLLPSLAIRPLSSPDQRQSIQLLLARGTSDNAMARKLSDFASAYRPDRSRPMIAQLAV